MGRDVEWSRFYWGEIDFKNLSLVIDNTKFYRIFPATEVSRGAEIVKSNFGPCDVAPAGARGALTRGLSLSYDTFENSTQARLAAAVGHQDGPPGELAAAHDRHRARFTSGNGNYRK